MFTTVRRVADELSIAQIDDQVQMFERQLADQLADTVGNVLALARAGREEQQVLGFLTQAESHFELDNDHALIVPLVGYLEKGLQRMDLCDPTGLIRVTVALREAFDALLAQPVDMAAASLRTLSSGERGAR